MLGQDCPCGSGLRYHVCCGRLHRREAEAATAEELMRSRYAAYAVGDLDHVFRTWHPRTRPETIEPGPHADLDRADHPRRGGRRTGDDAGEVEFEAAYERGGTPGRRHERSRFERRRGRWVYVDGYVGLADAPAMLTSQLTPNLSLTWPNSSPHGAFSSGTSMVPPSASLSK